MAFKLTVVLCLLALSFSKPSLGFRLPRGSRIIGGEEARIGEFPHQVSLQIKFFNYRHVCGGSILNEYWILTAAHCSDSLGVDIYVKAGTILNKDSENLYQRIKVDTVYVHEDYPSVEDSPYDIALLKLEKPLVFNENVQPIALPEANSEVDGEVILSGWGSTNPNGGSQPEILQKAYLPIIDNETCKKTVIDLVGKDLVVDSNVCTGPLTGGLSACMGDSGSPIIKVKNDGEKTIVGITSWTPILPCGSEGSPTVYTRVTSYLDWIQHIINNN